MCTFSVLLHFYTVQTPHERPVTASALLLQHPVPHKSDDMQLPRRVERKLLKAFLQLQKSSPF